MSYSVRTKSEYVKAYPCAVCGETVTLRQIMNGWIIECGCGEIHRSYNSLTPKESASWKLKRDS